MISEGERKKQVKTFYMNNFCAKTIYMKIPKIVYSSEIKQKKKNSSNIFICKTLRIKFKNQDTYFHNTKLIV